MIHTLLRPSFRNWLCCGVLVLAATAEAQVPEYYQWKAGETVWDDTAENWLVPPDFTSPAVLPAGADGAILSAETITVTGSRNVSPALRHLFAFAAVNATGIPNLLEYALGGHPVNGSTGRSILPTGSRPGNQMQLHFTRMLDRNDVDLTVQASPTLNTRTDLARSTAGQPFALLKSGTGMMKAAPETRVPSSSPIPPPAPAAS